MLCLAGDTQGSKEELAGEVPADPEIARSIGRYNCDFARELAQAGLAVAMAG